MKWGLDHVPCVLYTDGSTVCVFSLSRNQVGKLKVYGGKRKPKNKKELETGKRKREKKKVKDREKNIEKEKKVVRERKQRKKAKCEKGKNVHSR